ncbi:hypothetical protein [Aquimarina aquimarini]|uniref:hypothetical protein n=1 Tax=Aquimarina aquimarini TaxID=1191734 RepID=UPI000D562654|nr:hypothetical protein [Aquimarina aquimarini]
MNNLEIVKRSEFYIMLNTILREQLPKIKQRITPIYSQILKDRKFQHPLPIIYQFEYTTWGGNSQWRLELDFDDYQWSNKTVKPHFLIAFVNIEIAKDEVHFKYQFGNSFNDALQPIQPEKIKIDLLNDAAFVAEKIKEVNHFLDNLAKRFIQEIEKINFNELEFLEDDVRMNKKIQEKWKEGAVIGYDCITYGDGSVIMGDTYCVKDSETKEVKRYWFPLCDTTLTGIERHNEDIWTEVDIFHGAFEYENQKFVFGDGAMGNEGYIASIALNGELNWVIFFTFSNPINKAEVKNEHLICYGDTGAIIDIDLNNITKIEIVEQNDWTNQ